MDNTHTTDTAAAADRADTDTQQTTTTRTQHGTRHPTHGARAEQFILQQQEKQHLYLTTHQHHTRTHTTLPHTTHHTPTTTLHHTKHATQHSHTRDTAARHTVTPHTQQQLYQHQNSQRRSFRYVHPHKNKRESRMELERAREPLPSRDRTALNIKEQNSLTMTFAGKQGSKIKYQLYAGK